MNIQPELKGNIDEELDKKRMCGDGHLPLCRRTFVCNRKQS